MHFTVRDRPSKGLTWAPSRKRLFRTGACFSSRKAIEDFDYAVRDVSCNFTCVELADDACQRATFYLSYGVVEFFLIHKQLCRPSWPQQQQPLKVR